jgi:hypothetical protein
LRRFIPPLPNLSEVNKSFIGSEVGVALLPDLIAFRGSVSCCLEFALRVFESRLSRNVQAETVA